MTAAATHRHVTEALAPLLSAEGPGVAVAACRGGQQAVLVSGTAGGGDPVRPDTRFELGSLTKTFTALLLAEMVARGEVGHDDPIDRYLPAGTAPRRPITLAHLVTHRSGLPRLPPGLVRTALPAFFSNPYQAFGPDDVLKALRRTKVRSTPGARVRYSNFGVGLLGLLLARAADRPYEELLAERVLRPLALPDTGCASAPQATGHFHGTPRPPWRIPGLPGAGALRSTAPDMLAYLKALLAPHSTALPTALTDVVDRPGGPLIWNLRSRPDHDLLFHSGGTRGFTSFAGFSPQTGTALVALTNAGPTPRSRFIQRSYEALHRLAPPDA
ncbi:serine hydrolase domain-containing protein [Actinokineospora sp. 24-640]